MEEGNIMNMEILELLNLSKTFDGKSFALKDCSFSVSPGNILAIVGESGSGKSTILRLIAGLERPTQGIIRIKGKEVSNDGHILPPQQRNVGMVFQDFALFPHLTVAQNVGYGLKKDKAEKVNDLLQLIKMEEYANRFPGELSGGQEQRVALARTLAMNPDILLLDEPFSNLDAGLKAGLRQEIRQIVKEIGMTMVFITHDLLDALDIADELIFLKAGEILLHRPIEMIFKDVQNSEVEQTFRDLKSASQRILEMMRQK